MSEQIAVEQFLEYAPSVWNQHKEHLSAGIVSDGTDRAHCEYLILLDGCTVGHVQRLGKRVYVAITADLSAIGS